MLRVTTTHPAKLSGAFLLGLFISIWSANAGVSSLMVGLNIAYEQKETRGLIASTLTNSVFARCLRSCGSLRKPDLLAHWQHPHNPNSL